MWHLFGAVISCISLATSHRNVSAARNAKNWYKNSPSLECEHCKRVAECGQSVYFRLFVPDSIRARAWNEWRIQRVLLVSVPTCNRSLINHNRRVWQIKSIRSCRSIFHGDHRIQLTQLLETQHFTAKMCPFWSYWHHCKAIVVYGGITSCKIQF